MLAKVAEMHALRMACPEELSQTYLQEEFEREKTGDGATVRPTVDIKACEEKLKATHSLEELGTVWASLPPEAKVELNDLKNGLKAQFQV
jgi:hypothetical protein